MKALYSVEANLNRAEDSYSFLDFDDEETERNAKIIPSNIDSGLGIQKNNLAKRGALVH